MNETYNVYTPLYYTGSFTVDGAVTQQRRSLLGAYSAVNSRSGVGMKGYKDKIQRGDNATTPFSAQEFSLIKSASNLKAIYIPKIGGNAGKRCTQEIVGDIFKAPTPSASSLSTAVAQAKAYADFVSQITSIQQDVEGLAVIGEIKETLKMLRSPLKALRTAINSYLPTLQKRLRYAKRPAWPNVIGSTWLEWNFGVRPLVHDIDGAIAALASYGNNWIPGSVLQAYGKADGASSSTLNTTDPYHSRFSISVTTKSFDRVQCWYKCGVRGRYFPAKSNLEDLRGRLGFEFDRFVPSVYEVLPFSWLADYFTNAAAVTMHSWVNQSEVSWVCETIRKTRTNYATAKLNVAESKALLGYPDASYLSQLGYQMAIHKVVSRNPLSAVPAPPIVFWSPPVTSMKWLNIAGLLAQGNQWTHFRQSRGG